MGRSILLPLFCLLAMTAGCYASHERAATDAPLDAGRCAAPRLVARATALTCPAWSPLGEHVFVTLTQTIDACCRPDAELATEVRPTREGVEIIPGLSSCDCCALCGCVGEVTTRRIGIGRFFEGTSVDVTAGDMRCTFRLG